MGFPEPMLRGSRFDVPAALSICMRFAAAPAWSREDGEGENFQSAHVSPPRAAIRNTFREESAMQDEQKIRLFEQVAVPKAVMKLAVPTVLSSLVMVLYRCV